MPIINLQPSEESMNDTSTLPQREPVLTAASAGALVAALVYLLVQFGVPISDNQADAVGAFVVVAFPLVAAWLARRKVTPSDRVVERLGGDGTVVAGPASELPTDAMIRDVGEDYNATDEPDLSQYVEREQPEYDDDPAPRRGRDDDGDGRPDIA